MRKRVPRLGAEQTTAPEGRLEELIDAARARARGSGDAPSAALISLSALRLTEELDVGETAAAREHLPHAVDLAGEGLDADARRADAARVQRSRVVRLEHGCH